MRTEAVIRKRIDEIERIMNKELGRPADSPVQQWAAVKSYYQAQMTLHWVLEEPEVI